MGISIPNVAASIKDWYKKAKFYLVAIVLGITVTGSLFAPGLSYGQKLLVFGVGGAFGIILEILHSIESRLLAQEETVEFERLGDALPTIRKILTQGGKHKVEILASDGGYVTNDLLPALQKDQMKLCNELEIQVRLVNQSSGISALMPKHWKSNVEGNLNQLMAISGEQFKIMPIRYDYLPCVAGVLIDSQHLFLGFYAWITDKKMEGAGRPHTYYRRGDPKDEKYFTLFESWSTIAPGSRLVSPNPNT